MRISDWSSDVCSSDLPPVERGHAGDDVGTGGEPPADHCFGDLLRFGDAGCRAVKQNDAVGVRHQPPRLTRSARSWNRATATVSTSTAPAWRSEEHTSELQSLMRISYAVFCLKKKKKKQS